MYKPTAAVECGQRPIGGNNQQRKFVRGPIKVFIDRSFKHQLKKMKRISIKYYIPRLYRSSFFNVLYSYTIHHNIVMFSKFKMRSVNISDWKW